MSVPRELANVDFKKGRRLSHAFQVIEIQASGCVSSARAAQGLPSRSILTHKCVLPCPLTSQPTQMGSEQAAIGCEEKLTQLQ